MRKVNPMILISLVLAMLVLFFVIYFSMLSPARTATPIKLVTGEWSPYSGQEIEGYGISAAIVSYLFAQMGYQPEFEFLPWSLGENLVLSSQRNDNVRGIFPYVKTQSREQRFYLSDSIIDINYSVFYNPNTTPDGADITQASALKNYRVLTIEGYDYHPDINAVVPVQECAFNSTLDAFRFLADPRPIALLSDTPLNIAGRDLMVGATEMASDERDSPWHLYTFENAGEKTTGSDTIDILLASSRASEDAMTARYPAACVFRDPEKVIEAIRYFQRPAVVVEAVDVGEELLITTVPNLRRSIERAPYVQKMQLTVMFSRNNPNNLALRDDFNQRLAELKRDPSAFNALVKSAVRNANKARAVTLQGYDGESLVPAYAYLRKPRTCDTSQAIYLPKGTRAVVTRWHPAFLEFGQRVEHPMTNIRLLNGPMAQIDREWCVDGRAIELQ